MYQMKLKFEITYSIFPREVSDLLVLLGMKEETETTEYSFVQEIPFIPDQGLIHKYEGAVKKGFENAGNNIISVKFNGYEYLWKT